MKPAFDPLSLKNQLCFPVYLCAKQITNKYAPLLKAINLTYTQYIVMMYFWEFKQCTAHDICKSMFIDPSTLTPLIDKLVSKGFISKNKDKKDARKTILTLTQKGQELRKAALPIPEKIGKCVGLEPEEAETLAKLCYKSIQNLDAS